MRIAVLGTGRMGRPMAERLLEAGHQVVAFNRTRAKVAPVAEKRGRVVDTAAEAVGTAECVIVMLSDVDAIRTVLLSPETRAVLGGRTVLQMSTISPIESRELAEAVEATGGEYLEAPVLGSVPEATAGKLLILMGGTESQFERWLPVLRAFGPAPLRIGEVGQGAAVKLALNQLIASLTSAFALSFSLVRREGIDVERFMGILRESALYAPTFDKKLHRMVERDYSNPNFSTVHLDKDAGLVLREAERLGLDTSALQGVKRLIEKALETGHEEEDYSSIHDTIIGQ